jgi:hypothetical protein
MGACAVRRGEAQGVQETNSEVLRSTLTVAEGPEAIPALTGAGQHQKGNPMTRKDAEREQAIERLREIFKPGDTVYTVLRHVSRSGMSRSISILYSENPGDVVDVSFLLVRAMDYRFDRDRGGVKVGGCGMDMGFHLVYNMSHVLYPNGFTCTGERCPASDHSNGDRDYTPHEHKSGGYALQQRWL